MIRWFLLIWMIKWYDWEVIFQYIFVIARVRLLKWPCDKTVLRDWQDSSSFICDKVVRPSNMSDKQFYVHTSDKVIRWADKTDQGSRLCNMIDREIFCYVLVTVPCTVHNTTDWTSFCWHDILYALIWLAYLNDRVVNSVDMADRAIFCWYR